MSDEQAEPQVEAIHYTQATVLTVDRWPERTSFMPAWLERQAHERKARVDGDIVTIKASNGKAVYTLRRDLPTVAGAIVADLQEGDTPGRLKQRKRKYEPAADDEGENA